MITSQANEQLKTIRRLHDKRQRDRTGLFIAEGEDLVEAAEIAGFEPELLLVADIDVEPELLSSVSALGSGARTIGVYRQRWSARGGDLSVYLQGVGDPGNIGTIIRSAHALADGPVALGPGCADPFSPKAVRASMGSVFTRPPARARFEELIGTTVALGRMPGTRPLWEIVDRSSADQPPTDPPVTLCFGAEREGLPESVANRASMRAQIPLRPGGPDSLNVAMAATVALYEWTRTAVADDG